MNKYLQHVGVGVKDPRRLIPKLEELGFKLSSNFTLFTKEARDTEVYFYQYKDLVLEVYELEWEEPEAYIIDSIVITNHNLEYKEYALDYGLKIVNINEEEEALKYFTVNASDTKASEEYFKKLNFLKEQDYLVQNNVKILIKELKDKKLALGPVRHIAFDTDSIYADRVDFIKKGVDFDNNAVIEFLPFMDKGVVYFMTIGPDGINMEFNQILK